VTAAGPGGGIEGPRLEVYGIDGSAAIDEPISTLKAAWQEPLCYQ
jgi:hypothetical protein